MTTNNYFEIFSNYKLQVSYVNSKEKGALYYVLVKGRSTVIIPIVSLFTKRAFYSDAVNSFQKEIDAIAGEDAIIGDVAADDNPIRTMLSDESFPINLSTLQVILPDTILIFKYKETNKPVVFVTKFSTFSLLSSLLNEYFINYECIYSLLELKQLTVATTFTIQDGSCE
uniref:Uncharacterized protein n=1 Tax=Olive leaf mottling virus TaxID=3162628 RepID=A0AAU7YSA9_9CLOS